MHTRDDEPRYLTNESSRSGNSRWGRSAATTIAVPRIVEAQDLKCGDVFIFRDKRFLCMANVLDDQQLHTTVICIGDDDVVLPTSTYVFMLYRAFSVTVLKTRPMQITHATTTNEEIHGQRALEPIHNMRFKFLSIK